MDIAAASKVTIITCEELVPTDYFRKHTGRTTIAWLDVDAVIRVPYGSYPGNMPGGYFSDERHLKEWLDAEEDEAKLKEFLDRYIYSIKDFSEYLEKCGGKDRIEKLRKEELLE